MYSFYKLTNHYQPDQVQFRRPVRLGSYAVKKGLNQKATLLENAEDFCVKYSLKEFERTKSLDLKEGYEQRPNDDIYLSVGNLDEFLQWILANKHLFLLKNEQLVNGKLRNLNTDFVSFRGTLSLLLNISYDFKTSFTIHVEKFKGTHYLQLEKNDDQNGQDEASKSLFSYAGRRFELYVSEEFSEEDKLIMNPARKTSKDEFSNDGLGPQIATNLFEKHSTTHLCFAYRSRLNNFALCYGAEMDAFENVVKLDQPIDSSKIMGVEMKTSRKITNRRQEENFKRFKTLKWFTQSYLTNVRKISCGYWEHDQIVDEIKEYNLNDLKEMSDWDFELCLFQLNQILSFIAYCFNKHNTNLLKFTYSSFSYRIVCQDTDLSKVLPDYYKNQFVD